MPGALSGQAFNGWIDAHCHLSDPRFDGKLDAVFASASRAGVAAFVLGGVGPEDWERQKGLAHRFPGRVFPVFGIHPWFVDARHARSEGRAEVEEALAMLPLLLSECVAIGELGLDHGASRSEAGYPYQREIFERQLTLAKEARKPLVLHVVRAHGEAIEILRAQAPYPRGGLVHAFSGSAEVAWQYLDLGLTLSVGAAVARENGYETLKRAVAKLPEDRLVIESDCPDLKPDGYEGPLQSQGMNDPGCLPRVAEALGKLRGASAEIVLKASRANLVRVFGLELAADSD